MSINIRRRCRRSGKKNSLILLLLLLPSLLFAAPTATITPAGKKKQPVVIKLELAKTTRQQMRGLMHRKSLCPDCGMLFIFKESKIHHFWMKNTSIPLDMIFIDHHGVISGIIKNTKPYTTRGYAIKKPSRYVLEVNAHFCKKKGLKPGDQFIFKEIL